MACSKESSLRISANGESESLLPSFATSKTFAGSNGDTIKLYPINSTNYFDKSYSHLEQGGALSDLDYIELERSEITIGNDTLGYNIEFRLKTYYEDNLNSLARDQLFIDFIDSNGRDDGLLAFEHKDTLKCISPFCILTDSLVLSTGSTNFINTYQSGVGLNSNRSIVINSASGLLKFIDQDSVVYELIP